MTVKGMTGVLWFMLGLGVALAVVYLSIGAFETKAEIKGPMYALVSASGIAIGVYHPNDTTMARAVRLLVLSIAAISGLSAAWEWLQSEKAAFQWNAVGTAMVMTSALTLFSCASWEIKRLAQAKENTN